MENFVDQWLLAWTNKDTKKLLSYYDEEFLYLDPGTRGSITNKEHFEKYLTKLFGAFPKWEWLRVELFESSLKWRATFYTKKPVTVDGLDLLIIKNNLIVRNEVYFDQSLLLPSHRS